MVDNGAGINVCTLEIAEALGISEEDFTPCITTVKGYYGSTQESLGTICLKLRVGPQESDTIFHVVQCKTTFNPLLGRMWIHDHGAVPSSYHRCVKFPFQGHS